MPSNVFSATREESVALQLALDARPFTVVGLCAAWCDTCASFRETFEDLAGRRPEATFVWVDIEDDAALAGDIDVENFPTLAVFHRTRAIHFGVSLPHGGVVDRLLDSLNAASTTIITDAAVSDLPSKLTKGAGFRGEAR